MRAILYLAAALIQTQPTWAQDDTRAMIAAVEQVAPAALSRQGTPGLGVAIVFGGELIWSGGFGVTSLETGEPVTGDTVFEIASVTKPVTAWAMLKLAEEGRIDLDAPIESYLGGWTLPPSQFDHALVTARNILAHGAGLSKGGDSGVDPEEVPPTLLEAVDGATMEYGPVQVSHEPGEAYHYSSKGFVLLELTSKRHVFSSGREQGGNSLSRGQIHKILTNPVYLGLIRHKEKTYPGKHPAIITQALWKEVQDQLQAASARRRGAPAGLPGTGEAPLKGKFRDDTGDLLTPSHAVKSGRPCRYYISNRLVSGGTDPGGWRLPARAFETSVASLIAEHLADHACRHAVLCSGSALHSTLASEAVERLADEIQTAGICKAVALLANGRLGDRRIVLRLDAGAIASQTGLQAEALAPGLLEIDSPFTFRRRGVEMKIIAGSLAPAPDPSLIRALRNAHLWSAALKSGTPLNRLSIEAQVSERYLARIIALSGLSPRLQAAIVDGTQPIELTLKRLLRITLPLDRAAQERALGFAG